MSGNKFSVWNYSRSLVLHNSACSVFSLVVLNTLLMTCVDRYVASGGPAQRCITSVGWLCDRRGNVSINSSMKVCSYCAGKNQCNKINAKGSFMPKNACCDRRSWWPYYPSNDEKIKYISKDTLSKSEVLMKLYLRGKQLKNHTENSHSPWLMDMHSPIPNCRISFHLLTLW